MNPWPGNYEGIVQMPRLKRAGPTAGGAGPMPAPPAGGILAISGYADGQLINPFSGGSGPVWDGKFPFFNTSASVWIGFEVNFTDQISGGNVCKCFITPIDNGFRLYIGSDADDFNTLWIGERAGASIVGVYTSTGNGFNILPATYTVIQTGGTKQEVFNQGCSS